MAHLLGPRLWPILLLNVAVSPGTPLTGQSPFIRGDFNADGRVDLGDPVRLLFHLFEAGASGGCLAAGDASSDGTLDAGDAVFVLSYLFVEGANPAPPFPNCGTSADAETVTCIEHAACSNPDRAPEITEWPVPYGASSRPRDPYVDATGRVWFVGQNADYAAFLLQETGAFTRFPLPAGAGPHNLIVGERYVWYAGNGDAHIGRLDPATREVQRIDMPDPAASDPHTLVFDRNGDIYFTVQFGGFVGKLTVATGEVRLRAVPTPGAKPYGIAIDPTGRPWFDEFGTNKIASIDPETLSIEEVTLPRSSARPRRIGVTTDGAIWYVDYAGGYLGRVVPSTKAIDEWLMPGGARSRPYAMAVDDRDRIWFVETGSSPNRFVGFNPRTSQFFGATPIPSRGGTVRHMYFHAPERTIWFGTDANTIGKAIVE